MISFLDLTDFITLVKFFILKAVEGSKKGETVLVRKRGLTKRKDSDDDDSDDENDKTSPRKPKSSPTEEATTKEGTEVLLEKSQNGQKSETAPTIPAGREVCFFSLRNVENTVLSHHSKSLEKPKNKKLSVTNE